VLSAFDGVSLHEEAISGFDRSAVARAARSLIADRSFANGTVDPGPARSGDFSTPLAALSLQDQLDYCRDLQHRLRGLDERIVNAQVNFFVDETSSVFCNRTADLAQKIQRLRLTIVVVVSGPDGVRYDYIQIVGWQFKRCGLANRVADHGGQCPGLARREHIEPGDTPLSRPAVTGVMPMNPSDTAWKPICF
jgi:hypothetical protein